MSKEWFVIQFKPNSHHQAKKNLNRQGFKTFLPLHEIHFTKSLSICEKLLNHYFQGICSYHLIEQNPNGIK